jgi:hypothetical protein
MRRPGWPACLLAASLVVGCAGLPTFDSASGRQDTRVPYRHDRRDYLAFREAYPDLLEPNYLPFMVHRKPGTAAAGDLLIFCRWPAERMPLRFFIDEPVIPEALQDEFRPVDPSAYTEAVERAIAVWESDLEGLVTFERVEDPDEAMLHFRLLAEVAPTPEPDVRVLGSTEALHRACRPHGWDPDEESLKVSFEVSETVVYAADEFGMLTPAQVLAITLHEIGHVLGMMGHSPVSTDLMYRVLGERTARSGLTTSDVNSFVSLYRLPNGGHYGLVPPDGLSPPRAPGPPSGAPELSVAPYVDPRFGYELRTPAGWLRVESGHGIFAANGPIWDHDASFEISVWPYATIEEFLDRFGSSLFANTWRRSSAPTEVDRRRALEIAVEDPSGTHSLNFFFVEIGDGRVMVVLASAPVDVFEQWRPWFMSALASLEIWPHVSDEVRNGVGEAGTDAGTGAR